MFCIFPGAAKIPHRPSPKLAVHSVGLRLNAVATQQLLPILSQAASGGTMREIEPTFPPLRLPQKEPRWPDLPPP